MTIKHISNRRVSFPMVGILRKGAKKIQDNKPGADLTYFRFVSDDVDANRAFAAAYGAEPRRVNVLLPFATTDENLDAWMEHWGAGSLKHRCDGETCVLWQDDDGSYRTDPIPCPSKAQGLQGKPNGCRPTVRLQVIVPELARLAHVLVLSTSWHDAAELDGNLRAAENTARMMGFDLRGIPFVLTRCERAISTPPREKGGKRLRSKKWLLHLEVAQSWVALQIAAAQQMATPQLPKPDNGDTVDAVGTIVNPGEQDEDEENGNGNGDDNRSVDPETGEITDGKPAEHAETEAAESSRHDKLVARLHEIESDLNAIGQDVTLDPTWLQEATEDQLVAEGQRMKRRLDQAKKAQAKLDLNTVANEPSEAVK